MLDYTVVLINRSGFEMWAVYSNGSLVPRSERWSKGAAEVVAMGLRSPRPAPAPEKKTCPLCSPE